MSLDADVAEMTGAGAAASSVGRRSAASAAGSLVPAQRGDAVSSVARGLGIGTHEPDTTIGTWLRVWGLHVEFALATICGGLVVVSSSEPWLATAALAVWVTGAFHRNSGVSSPLQRQLGAVVSAALLPAAGLVLVAATVGTAPVDLRYALGTVAAAAGVTALSRSLRWTLQAPVRVVVVGDRAAVARAATRLPRTSRSRVVGAVVVEEGLAHDDGPSQVLGVTTSTDLGEISQVVTDHRADLVLVDPGRGVTSSDFRAMTWALESTRVAIGVLGVFGSVAPHRMDAGTLGRNSVLDVRHPRQSRLVLGVKSSADRALGLLLLVMMAPLLVALILAVRWDSPGPALFTQVRIGRGGREFRLYKLRTMVAGADEHKDVLEADNEADSVLFKVREDPRVTRLGGFLRRSSLDELPQLVNVARGEMSLVGPRPHLPEEVELMDTSTRRRHVVRPGMTGAWQVNGRSDLTWREASELDTFYADNWSLRGDLRLLGRTVRAVLSQKGAY